MDLPGLALAPELFDAINVPDSCEEPVALPALIAYLTSEKIIDYTSMADFFLTFRTYTSTHTLAGLLISRLLWSLQSPAKNETKRDVAVRSFVVLRHWLQNYFADDFVPNEHLRNCFSHAINSIYLWASAPLLNGVQDSVWLRIPYQLKHCWLVQLKKYYAISVPLDPDAPVPSGAMNRRIETHSCPNTRRKTLIGIYKSHQEPLTQAGLLIGGKVDPVMDATVPEVTLVKPKSTRTYLGLLRKKAKPAKPINLVGKVDVLVLKTLEELRGLMSHARSSAGSTSSQETLRSNTTVVIKPSPDRKAPFCSAPADVSSVGHMCTRHCSLPEYLERDMWPVPELVPRVGRLSLPLRVSDLPETLPELNASGSDSLPEGLNESNVPEDCACEELCSEPHGSKVFERHESVYSKVHDSKAYSEMHGSVCSEVSCSKCCSMVGSKVCSMVSQGSIHPYGTMGECESGNDSDCWGVSLRRSAGIPGLDGLGIETVSYRCSTSTIASLSPLSSVRSGFQSSISLLSEMSNEMQMAPCAGFNSRIAAELAAIPDEHTDDPITATIQKLEGTYRKDRELPRVSLESVISDIYTQAFASQTNIAAHLQDEVEALGVPQGTAQTIAQRREPKLEVLKGEQVDITHDHIPFILGLDANEAAQQMTLIESDAVRQVDWQELVEAKWPPPKRDIESWVRFLINDGGSSQRGVNLVTARFSLAVLWVQSQVLLCRQASLMAATISKFVEIACASHRLQNFATMMQIINGLTSEIVQREKTALSLLSPQIQRQLDGLVQIGAPLDGFKRLRKLHTSIDYTRGCVPFMGLYLSDLELNAQKPDRINGLVNFTKFKRAALVTRAFIQCVEWTQHYALAPEPSILSRCLYLSCLPAEMLRVE